MEKYPETSKKGGRAVDGAYRREVKAIPRKDKEANFYPTSI